MQERVVFSISHQLYFGSDESPGHLKEIKYIWMSKPDLFYFFGAFASTSLKCQNVYIYIYTLD